MKTRTRNAVMRGARLDVDGRDRIPNFVSRIHASICACHFVEKHAGTQTAAERHG